MIVYNLPYLQSLYFRFDFDNPIIDLTFIIGYFLLLDNPTNFLLIFFLIGK